MNYIMQINAFERWLETNHLPALSQLLWYRLMALFNRCGWKEWITADNPRLMTLIQTRREGTLIVVRKSLIEAGLLEYKEGKKGSPGQYRMLFFTTDLKVHGVMNTEVQSEVNTEVHGVVNTEVQSEVQTVDINKQNKTKKIKKDTNVSTKRFQPPTVGEVQEYCAQRRNSIDAENFVDFYTGKDWMIGKNKMKDWKAAIRTWEKNHKKWEGEKHDVRAKDRGLNEPVYENTITAEEAGEIKFYGF